MIEFFQLMWTGNAYPKFVIVVVGGFFIWALASCWLAERRLSYAKLKKVARENR